MLVVGGELVEALRSKRGPIRLRSGQALRSVVRRGPSLRSDGRKKKLGYVGRDDSLVAGGKLVEGV